MNRTYRSLPVYAGDVSGACSALFELGGMTVIHDPSGCNSTYNTHDETRWYDHDSLIFLSGLTEREAVFGNDEKLIRDTADAAETLGPAFIALCNSPIPYINGTDLRAVARILEHRTGIPSFYIPTNGMHDYTVGAGRAFRCYAERFVSGGGRSRKDSLNILGLTPLDYGLYASCAPFEAFAAEYGWSVVSCWAMGCPPETLRHASEAQVSLVVSAAGIPTAQYLYDTYGIPYAAGCPVGRFRAGLAKALRTARDEHRNIIAYHDRLPSGPAGGWMAMGEPILMGSLAAAAEKETGMPVRLVCPLETPGFLLGPDDLAVEGEEEAEKAVCRASLLLADPMYSRFLPEGARLIGIPHQAFSGRNGWAGARDLTALDVAALFR